MTRVVDQLEAMGLARRVRLERDYRRHGIELTAQGRKMHAQLVQVQVASLNRMLCGFSRAEARTLESLLKRIVENALG